MNVSIVLWTLLATGIFWGVGAYNRVTRLRARAAESLGPLGKCMQSYAALMETHGHEPAAAVPEWLHIRALAMELEPLLEATLKAPVDTEAILRLDAMHSELQSAWKTLNDTPADLAGGVIPEALRVQWDAATFKTQMAWESTQEAMQSLSAATSQFPASLLVRSMGLKAKHEK